MKQSRAGQSKSRGGALGTAAAEQGAPLLAHRCTTRDAPKVPNLPTHSTQPPNPQYPTSKAKVTNLKTLSIQPPNQDDNLPICDKNPPNGHSPPSNKTNLRVNSTFQLSNCPLQLLVQSSISLSCSTVVLSFYKFLSSPLPSFFVAF